MPWLGIGKGERGGEEEVAGEVINVRSGFLMEPRGIYAAINGAAGD